MKYSQTQMNNLVKSNKELQKHLRQIMEDNELEKEFALKALYHAEVADGGKYQSAYQSLD